MPKLEFDQELIRRYDTSGPRYTSYPTAAQFTTDFTAASYHEQVELSNGSGRPLSLYFHIPFCDTVCFYCACNKVITKNRAHAQPYLNNVYKELAMQAAMFDTSRPVDQLHWGGGTPTFISHAQMRELMQVTRDHFALHDDDSGEYSIEVDPREADADTIALLRELGFNRLSLGVQDFDPRVQKAVNRIQSVAQTAEVLNAARATGFHSVSVDLIYGLPHQTVASFNTTLQTVLELSPDRLSVFNYAHLPDLFKTQRQIRTEDIPSPSTKLAILQDCIETLTAAGYIYIGMDHFAKPDDELARAQASGSLYRNFQGYSTHADCDLIGIGATSIGKVHDCYSQNQRTLDDYAKCIAADQLPVFRGVTLDADDKLRREVITQLICHFSLDISDIEARHDIRFADYFANALPQLQTMAADGLLEIDNKRITVTGRGSLLIRNICMTFDKYLTGQQRFSKVI
ncbi:MAG: oxygen-independent coproporphyrinogen III oxidase [Gammaproteobacteria bacterium]|nr:oxygen-independent coproporphyrinogen III oxidase [Gammaproteobacteria bacterium]